MTSSHPSKIKEIALIKTLICQKLWKILIYTLKIINQEINISFHSFPHKLGKTNYQLHKYNNKSKMNDDNICVQLLSNQIEHLVPDFSCTLHQLSFFRIQMLMPYSPASSHTHNLVFDQHERSFRSDS